MANDLYRFVITNGLVTAVYEEQDGAWRQKSIDANDTFALGTNQVTWAERYATHIEVKVFTLVSGDQYVETSETYLQPDGTPFPAGSQFGDDSDNRISGDDDSDTILGGGGSDDLGGWGGDDTLFGGIGEDTIRGGSGADDIGGDDGDDRLAGEDGNDRLRGGNGRDDIAGDLGDDRLLGEAGDDRMRGGHGRDDVNGGIGNDDLAGDGGNDTLLGGAGDDRLNGGLDDDRLVCGDGRDVALGGAGKDTMLGGLGDDRLFGHAGDDRLLGEAGNDVVEGGLGLDLLAGGGGIDVFRFSTHGATNADTVLDFAHGVDRIALSGTVFGGLVAGPLAAAAFEANDSGAASGAGVRFVYETDTGRLSYDADGSGAGTASLIAVFSNLAPITASDISVF